MICCGRAFRQLEYAGLIDPETGLYKPINFEFFKFDKILEEVHGINS